MKETKMDNTTTILKWKKVDNCLVVNEAILMIASCSLCILTTWKNCIGFTELQFLSRARRDDMIYIALTEDMCEETKIRMNKVEHSNMRVWLGDVILVH
jgi:hypothetical protein